MNDREHVDVSYTNVIINYTFVGNISLVGVMVESMGTPVKGASTDGVFV